MEADLDPVRISSLGDAFVCECLLLLRQGETGDPASTIACYVDGE